MGQRGLLSFIGRSTSWNTQNTSKAEVRRLSHSRRCAATVGSRPFYVSGSVVDAVSRPLSGVTCSIERRSTANQRWKAVATVTTAEDGTWRARCVSTSRATWRVTTPERVLGYTCGYGPRAIVPRLELSPPTTAKSPHAGAAVAVSGRVISPVRLAGPVRLVLQREVGSKWVTWKRVSVRAKYLGARGSRLACGVEFPRAGRWRLRFESPQNASHGSSTSEFLSVRVQAGVKNPVAASADEAYGFRYVNACIPSRSSRLAERRVASVSRELR